MVSSDLVDDFRNQALLAPPSGECETRDSGADNHA
jgi:hypothetical protein